MLPSVLIVDDDKALLAAFARTYRGRFEVTTAESGREALDLIGSRSTFPVVVSDMRMPGMLGTEFLKEVAAASPDSARIMLTGYADLGTVVRAVNKGHVFSFLTKPCDEETLAGAIDAGTTHFRLQQSQRVERLGSLAGGVSHELNNVLAAILSMSTMLQSRVGPEDPMARHLETITRACLRGRDVVRDLLVFARRGLEEERSLDLHGILEGLEALLPAAAGQGVVLRLDLAEPAPTLLGDGRDLTRALLGLCSNAVAAMPAGGTLTLTTRRDPGGDLVLTVRDTGAGMSPEVLAQAIEPFFTTRQTGQGTGLGLSMAYGTLKAHGGDLVLRSREGEGTEAILTFPAARVGVARTAAQAVPCQ